MSNEWISDSLSRVFSGHSRAPWAFLCFTKFGFVVNTNDTIKIIIRYVVKIFFLSCIHHRLLLIINFNYVQISRYVFKTAALAWRCVIFGKNYLISINSLNFLNKTSRFFAKRCVAYLRTSHFTLQFLWVIIRILGLLLYANALLMVKCRYSFTQNWPLIEDTYWIRIIF